MELTMITWKIGSCMISDFEKLTGSPDQNILEELVQINAVFLLRTCQRVIIVLATEDRSIIEMIIEEYTHDLLAYPKPDILTGNDALFRLLQIISSLDSIVIGEDQIQNQFKKAFQISEPYMDSDLKRIIQLVIRTGKRVRNKTALKFGKSSTFSLIASKFGNELTEAQSIGILGTGKLTSSIMKNLVEINPKITIYTMHRDRAGEFIDNYKIEFIDDLQKHDILFTITITESPIITEQNIGDIILADNIFVFDLGMPRNCDLVNTDTVKIFDLKDLLDIREDADEDGINKFLKAEFEHIIKEIKRYEKSELVINLREDILEVVENSRTRLIPDTVDDELQREFDLMVKKLMHVSIMHLRQAIE